jgi:DNA-binding response OmpR family regulator
MEENIQPRDTVLFVDDEENILRAIRRELMDEDYNCLYAESGGKALYLRELQNRTTVRQCRDYTRHPS